MFYILLIIKDNWSFIDYSWEMYEICLPSMSVTGLIHQNDAISKEDVQIIWAPGSLLFLPHVPTEWGIKQPLQMAN